MPASAHRRLGFAWLLLCAAIALHVLDEAFTGFLSVYNPTVEILRARLPWFPGRPLDDYAWLGGLSFGIFVLFCLAPFAFANARWFRPFAWLLSILMILNAILHTLATIAGRTVPEVTFPRPMPGFWSSPVLFAAALYLILQLSRTARPEPAQLRSS